MNADRECINYRGEEDLQRDGGKRTIPNEDNKKVREIYTTDEIPQKDQNENELEEKSIFTTSFKRTNFTDVK